MIAGTVEGAGVELAYREAGVGRPVVVVHDRATDALAWTSALARLGGRAIAYDRRGYGASGAPQGYAATTVEEQAEDLAALLRALDAAPALLLGDGFGALVALDAAKRHRGLVSGLVLADTPLFALVAAATPALARQRSALEDAMRADGRDAGVMLLAGAGGDGEARVRACAASAAVFADYVGASSWPVTRRQLRALDVPAAVTTRPGAQAHVVAASDALAALMPTATRGRAADPVAVAAAR